MVNGEMWIPQSFGPFSQTTLEARWLGGNLQIAAQNFKSSPVETEMDIRLVSVTGPGTYLLNGTGPHPSNVYNYAYFVKRNLTPLNEWITSSAYTGAVVITKLDTVNRIASGTFQFTAGEINASAAALNVTDGRFDVKF
jgi:hypothetical protein